MVNWSVRPRVRTFQLLSPPSRLCFASAMHAWRNYVTVNLCILCIARLHHSVFPRTAIFRVSLLLPLTFPSSLPSPFLPFPTLSIQPPLPFLTFPSPFPSLDFPFPPLSLFFLSHPFHPSISISLPFRHLPSSFSSGGIGMLPVLRCRYYSSSATLWFSSCHWRYYCR